MVSNECLFNASEFNLPFADKKSFAAASALPRCSSSALFPPEPPEPIKPALSPLSTAKLWATLLSN